MKRGRRAIALTASRCVLDSGGLTGLIGRAQRARATLRWIVESAGSIVVPTPILAECTTGDLARDAELNRILRVLQCVSTSLRPPDERTVRRAGQLRFRARAGDGIDALVAAEAASDGRPCVVLTSDPADLRRLLATEPQVAVRAV